MNQKSQLGRAIRIILPLIASCAVEGADAGIVLLGQKYEASVVDSVAGEVSFTLHDMNQDGHLDLIATHQNTEEIAIFQGDGTGRLKRVGTAPAGLMPNRTAVADLNADGRLDLIVANHETRHVSVLAGQGDFSFEPQGEGGTIAFAVEPHVHHVEVADVDGDDWPDLIVDDRDAGGLGWRKGGQSGFEKGLKRVDMGGDPYLGFVTVDIEHDGDVDLVSPGPNSVAVAINRGAGVFEAPIQLAAPGSFAVESGDMNQDGLPDLVSASQGDELRLWIQSAGGTFDLTNTVTVSSGPKAVVLGDLDGDQSPEILVAAWSGALEVLSGTDTDQSDRVTLAGIDHPWGLAAGDLNGDGRADIVIADGESSAAVVLLSQ